MRLRTALERSALITLSIFVICTAGYGQRDSIYRLPAGTRITLKLDAELSSRVAGRNDTFVAAVAQPVTIRDAIVLPVGTLVEGRVADAKPASAGGQPGKLDLEFLTIKFSEDTTRSIQGTLVESLAAKPNKSVGILGILGGAGAGALIGGATGSGRNAAIGGGVGAAIGAGFMLSRKGKEVGIKKDAEFVIELKKEVVLPVMDY